jgi:hypothetical protein
MLGCDDNDDYCNVKKKINSKLGWLNKCTFLTMNDQIIHGCIETHCNVSFQKGNKKYEHMTNFTTGSFNDILGRCDNMGVFVHDDCWKYVKNEFDVELKYSSFPIDKTNIKYYDKILNINYGKIEAYWSQDFQFDVAYKKGHSYLCESPLKNTESAKAIKKILTILKIKDKKERMSPSTSATFYKSGIIKVGIDGNFWKISKGKWVKMQGDVKLSKVSVDILDKKAIKKLNSLNQIGDICNGTIAIKSFEYDKKKKKVNLILLHIVNENHE